MKNKIAITKTDSSRIDEIDFDNIPFGREFTDHMFVADYSGGSWDNARIIPFGDLKMHPSMMALHYGQSIFEGMKSTKTVDGKALLFRPEMHAKRINESARRMYMPEIPEDLFLEAIHAIVDIDRNWIPEAEGSAMYLRPFMFATDEFIGVAPSATYRFIIIALPVGPYYSKPVSLLAEHHYVRAVEGGVGEAKTCGNYAASLLPAQLAKSKGYDQVLWLDSKEFKYVQEVGTMNIFFVFKDKVVTPATTGAILKGITRNTILQVLKERNIKVEERKISIDEVIEAGKSGDLIEVFGSGTAAVIANVSKLTNNDDTITFTEEDYKLSYEIKDYINGLRNGTVEDTHDWIVPVKSSVVA